MKSTTSMVMWASKRTVFVLGLLAMVATLLAAGPASASSPSNVSLTFHKYDPSCGCAQETSTLKAGDGLGYDVTFTSTSALSDGANDTITVSAPAGTKFPASKFHYQINVGVSGYGVANNVTLSNNGATVTIPLSGTSINIGAGTRVTVLAGMFTEHVTNPTTAGTYSLTVATSGDTTPAASGSYTITPNDPSEVSAVGGASFARVGTEFLPLAAKVTDAYGNAVPGQTVSFEAPESGPSGTFASSGSETDTATTGANGEATSSAFTANTAAGAYEVQASSGSLAPAALPMRNTPGPATGVAVELEPGSIPANGASTTAATATVTDEYGNGVADEDVSFASDGGQQIGEVTDNGDGTYEARITSTTVLGESTITATDNSVDPAVSDTATLGQVEATAPTVTATKPANKASEVRRGATLTATFSEAMNDATITGSTFKLYRVNPNGSRTPIDAAVTLLDTPSPGGLRAELDPFGSTTKTLQPDARYKAVVTTGARDLAGNALDQTRAEAGSQRKSWTFITGRR